MPTARKTETDTNAWVSIAEAARMLGETRHLLLVRSVKGEIETQYIAGRTIVSRASVERLLATREI